MFIQYYFLSMLEGIAILNRVHCSGGKGKRSGIGADCVNIWWGMTTSTINSIEHLEETLKN